jgi:hypothetical protein
MGALQELARHGGSELLLNAESGRHVLEGRHGDGFNVRGNAGGLARYVVAARSEEKQAAGSKQ